MRIERATRDDLPAVTALLSDAGLPLDGVAQAFATGVLARDGAAIVGAAALEPYDGAALLRSVVVAPDRRGTGVASDLVREAESLARRSGAVDIYLITETAAGYFPRLGYAEVARTEVPASIAESVEFTTSCSTSAVVMHRALRSPGS